MNPNLVEFKKHRRDDGCLIALEQQKEIPFEVRRLYYVFDTTAGARRGRHAHRFAKQLAICTNGACTISLDDGAQKSSVTLNSNDMGLILRPMVWHEIYDFSPQCTLVVLASEVYDEANCIRDYDAFIREKVSQ